MCVEVSGDGDPESSVVGRSDVVEFTADFRSREVKPLWLLRMNTRSPEWDEGIDAIVAGCDCPGPNLGMDKKTCAPGLHFLIALHLTVILVTPPSRAVMIALGGRALFHAHLRYRIPRSNT